MKSLPSYNLEVSRYLFFKAPPEDNFGSPEWNDPEKSKQIALKKLCDLRGLTLNENLLMCLQLLELLITDSLEFEISDDNNLKNYFIEKLHGLDLPTLVSEINQAFTQLNIRKDFDLSKATPETYFSGFIICWMELSQLA